jgi:sugar O-acyltransferase (sialic acid O-acetyltransferase NeuD family)
VGAGGHGQVVADILSSCVRAGDSLEIVGYLDDDPGLSNKALVGGRVLGPLHARRLIPHDALIVSIGDNAVRRETFLKLSAEGGQFAVARHHATIVGEDVEIGPGTIMSAGVILNPCVRVGRNVILNTGCSIDHHCVVGDHAHIAPGARLGGHVVVGDSTLVGIGAVVLPGVRIGHNAIVGGGAVVTENVSDGATVVGNPARSLERRSSRPGSHDGLDP